MFGEGSLDVLILLCISCILIVCSYFFTLICLTSFILLELVSECQSVHCRNKHQRVNRSVKACVRKGWKINVNRWVCSICNETDDKIESGMFFIRSHGTFPRISLPIRTSHLLTFLVSTFTRQNVSLGSHLENFKTNLTWHVLAIILACMSAVTLAFNFFGFNAFLWFFFKTTF